MTMDKSPNYVELILPPTETRPHRFIRLGNSLECILVHDAACDKAAASMDVAVGHLEDPVDLPGCAHFCEHMLSRGTGKYPEDNAYSKYLSENGGESNAYTGLSNTNYRFEVAPTALLGALDRFACFFIEPLFNPACTEREVNAVNSEHSANLQSDIWRFFQLEKHLSSPNHPFSKFGTGSLETLWETPNRQGRNPTAELAEWWKKEYCARRMKLVVVGKQDLDTLEEWVRERFEAASVRTTEAEARLVYSEQVLEKEQTGVGVSQSIQKIVFAEPVMDLRGLEITFPFSDLSSAYDSKPGNYLSHALGNGGPGSILSHLKRRGWVYSLRAGFQRRAPGFDSYKITLHLTVEGLANHRQVAISVFKYISLLRSTPPQEYLFNDIKSLSALKFRFLEPRPASSYASELSKQMQQPVPREKIISSQILVERFHPVGVRNVLQMLDVEKCVIAVTAKDLPESVGRLDQVEPVYGTKYKVNSMSREFLDEALSDTPLPEVFLPGPNPFIPTNLQVPVKVYATQSLERPNLLKDMPASRLWYKADDRFGVPRANVCVALRSPFLNSTARQSTLASLLCELFRDSIEEELFDIERAGLQFSIDFADDAIFVKATGFNDRLTIVVKSMLTALRSFKSAPGRFDGIKDTLHRKWISTQFEEPHSLAAYYAEYVQTEKMYTPVERVKELATIAITDMQSFTNEVFSGLSIETLIHGNFDAKGAMDLQENIEKALHLEATSPANWVAKQVGMLPQGTEHVWKIDVPNPNNVNSACEYYCEVGSVEDDTTRSRLAFLADIASEPAFNILRSKEQLGYVIWSGQRSTMSTTGFRILLQSEKSAAFIESRIEGFFDYLRDLLTEMSNDRFETIRAGFMSKHSALPTNLGAETLEYWTAIRDNHYDFERKTRDLAVLSTTTKQDIIDLFMKFIHPSSSSRTKLSIHLDSQYKGVKFDPQQAMPMIQAFMMNQVPVSQQKLFALMSTQPGVAEMQAFARACLSGASALPAHNRVGLEAMIDGLVGMVETSDAIATLKGTNKIITDLAAFKDKLQSSKAT
ncbi:hypothetical protein QFC22_005909 [Naganishia vaughanmartiniae]|uniref:Uncharacterized protein n=1 Tax=Naganishia vaughanmartiniae TaxID=1424756 RepID=A0ACC2WSF1_9TREE|nr:hypothetical protein QFC22_005909 [Naganishia vaughanmartiniae]